MKYFDQTDAWYLDILKWVIRFLVLSQFILLVFRLLNIIDWDWFYVMVPIWGPILLWAISPVVIGILAAIWFGMFPQK